MIALSLVLGVMFSGAALSQVKLQLVQTDDTLSKAEKAKIRTKYRTLQPERGEILSVDGRPLAANAEASELTINFAKAPMSEAFAMDVAQATGVPAAEIREAGEASIGKKSRGATWKVNLGPESHDLIADLRKKWGADGLSLLDSGHRVYPLGEAAACLVGSIRKLWVPAEIPKPGDTKPPKPAHVEDVRTGLEGSKDALLTGSAGRLQGLTDNRGAFLPTHMEDTGETRRDGEEIRLTIDSDLQVTAYEALRDGVIANNAQHGAAIVLEPSTGNILAMANYPSTDPNEDAEKKPGMSDFNFAYRAGLPPGSTFKILTLAEAYEVCPTVVSQTIYCSGQKHFDDGGTIHEDNGKHHGPVDAGGAIAASCNVAASTWAQAIGHVRYEDYLHRLGVLDPPELGLPREVSGRYAAQDSKKYQVLRWGFGQSIDVTPVALASAISMIGNQGIRMKPRLIDSIGGVRQPVQAVGAPIVSAGTADKVMKCMEEVFYGDHGTAKRLQIPGYRLAGKTGTAQKIGVIETKVVNGKKVRVPVRGAVANFVGFVPSGKPKAVILVMIDQPTAGTHHGNAVSGPVFLKLANAVIHRYDIQPTESVAPVTPPRRTN